MAALGTRLLTITIDAVDYTAEVSSAIISSAERKSDFLSFADAAAGGGREYSLKLKFVQDPSTASLWDKVWTVAGTDVPVVLMPAGGVVGPTKPKFTGTVTVTEPSGDLLGGDADASTSARWVTEVEWIYVSKPVRAFA